MQTVIALRWRTTLTSATHLGLTVSMAVWLAVFAPMLCQYHGLMWNHPHMDEMSADDATWDDPVPAMDMSNMTTTEHQEHLRNLAMRHTTTESPPLHTLHTSLRRAVLPLNDVNSAGNAALYNRVPSVAMMLVSIMLIHSPSHTLVVMRDNEPTRLAPESSKFPLQLAIPPLEQPPRP